MQSGKSKVLPTKARLKKSFLVLCYDDHVLLNNYVDHHLFTVRKERLLPNEVILFYQTIRIFQILKAKFFDSPTPAHALFQVNMPPKDLIQENQNCPKHLLYLHAAPDIPSP